MLLETVDAKVVLSAGLHDGSGERDEWLSLAEHLEADMNKRVLTKVILPALDNDCVRVITYKVMRVANVCCLGKSAQKRKRIIPLM